MHQSPFVLGLSQAKLGRSSNGRFFFERCARRKRRCFDKLSTNG
jgi:hypothetical protein